MPYVTQRLQDAPGPVVAVSDYMRQSRTRSRPWVPGDFASLGADGFGFSDTRPAARRFFHIDGPSVAVRALQMLAKRGEIDPAVARGRPSATGCSMSPPAPPVTRAAMPDRTASARIRIRMPAYPLVPGR